MPHHLERPAGCTLVSAHVFREMSIRHGDETWHKRFYGRSEDVFFFQRCRELGGEVRIGMHTGECELIGDDVGGMAVHLASRVCGLAGAGEALVSGTVFGTVVGGPFKFEDRGFHQLKGIPGRWPLFALGG